MKKLKQLIIDNYIFAGIFILSFLFTAYLLIKYQYFGEDTENYVFSTINYFKGKGFTHFGKHSGIVGPGWGGVIWFLSLFTRNLELSANIIVALSYLASILIIYCSFNKYLSKNIAIIIAASFAFNPFILSYSTITYTEMFYIFLSISAFSLLLHFTYNNLNPKKSILLGFVLGYMYLTRGEGFFLGVIALMFMLVYSLVLKKQKKPYSFTPIMYVSISFFVLVVVNIINFYLRTGEITISGMVSAHVNSVSRRVAENIAEPSAFEAVAIYFKKFIFDFHRAYLHVIKNAIYGIFPFLIVMFLYSLLEKKLKASALFFIMIFYIISTLHTYSEQQLMSYLSVKYILLFIISLFIIYMIIKISFSRIDNIVQKPLLVSFVFIPIFFIYPIGHHVQPRYIMMTYIFFFISFISVLYYLAEKYKTNINTKKTIAVILLILFFSSGVFNMLTFRLFGKEYTKLYGYTLSYLLTKKDDKTYHYLGQYEGHRQAGKWLSENVNDISKIKIATTRRPQLLLFYANNSLDDKGKYYNIPNNLSLNQFVDSLNANNVTHVIYEPNFIHIQPILNEFKEAVNKNEVNWEMIYSNKEEDVIIFNRILN